MVLHLCNDLMLIGKVSAWAKARQLAYRNASSLSKFETCLQEDPVTRVAVDLQFPALDIDWVVERVRSQSPTIELIGYAQHVMTELIEAATYAGFQEVLTRGQFDRSFAKLLG
jgi:hypothetical protein